jgi:hypothetical protein
LYDDDRVRDRQETGYTGIDQSDRKKHPEEEQTSSGPAIRER